MNNKNILIASVVAFLFVSPCNAEVVFEDDFNYSWTFTGTGPNYYPCTKEGGGSCGGSDYGPTAESVGSRTNSNGWNGWSRTSTSYIMDIGSGHGRNGTNGFKVTYPSSAYGSSTEPRLYKWLGADGHDELYISWWFKFDDDGSDRWDWGDNDGGHFAFFKQIRIYQDVDLEAMKHDCRPGYTSEYHVHPSNYGNFAIFNWNNAGAYSSGSRDYLPVMAGFTVSGNVWSTSDNTYHRWYSHWDYGGTESDECAIGYDGATSSWRAGPVYSYAESSTLAGEWKNSQDWHHVEYHLKLRDVTEGTQRNATYVSSTQLSVSGDYTSEFADGDEAMIRGCGQFSDCQTPISRRVSGSTYGGGITTITFYNDPGYATGGDFFSSGVTTVAKLTENAAGVFEVFIDGTTCGTLTTPSTINGISVAGSNKNNLSSAFGGLNFILLPDNRYYLVPHETTMYIDDFVVSTTKTGTSYTIGEAPEPATGTTMGGGTGSTAMGGGSGSTTIGE